MPWTEKPGGLQAIVSQSRTWLKWQHAWSRKVKFTHQSGPSDLFLGFLHASPHTTVRVILLNESSHEPALQNIMILFHLKQGNSQSFYKHHSPELSFWISFSTISPSFSTTLKKQIHRETHRAFALMLSDLRKFVSQIPSCIYLNSFNFCSYIIG